MLQTFLFIFIAGCLAWFLARMFPRRAQPGSGGTGHSARANPFSSASVHPRPTGCPAAKAIKGKRYLCREAPRLPLAECTAKNCQCVYRHHEDRRSHGADRRGLGYTGEYLLRRGITNRRRGTARREADKESDLSWT
jgi:hypothetical protein